MITIALMLAMITSASDYRYVYNLSDIQIDGGIMPLRENKKILRGEDIAFLQESYLERRFAMCVGNVSDYPSSFVNVLSESVCTNFDHGGIIESCALRPDLQRETIIYSQFYETSWNDFFSNYSNAFVSVPKIPFSGAVLSNNVFLAAFDNQKQMTKFYTPDKAKVFSTFSITVPRRTEYGTLQTSYSDECFGYTQHPGYTPPIEFYDNPLTSSSSNYEQQINEGEIVAFKYYEDSLLNLEQHDYPSYVDVTMNRWDSECKRFNGNTSYNLFMLTAGSVNEVMGATYELVCSFSYYQGYLISGLNEATNNISGSVTRNGYIIGSPVVCPSSRFIFVPISNVITAQRIDDIRRNCRLINPDSYDFMMPTAHPQERELAEYLPYYGYSEEYYHRRYNESLIVKPMGFIVTLGNHTKWW